MKIVNGEIPSIIFTKKLHRRCLTELQKRPSNVKGSKATSELVVVELEHIQQINQFFFQTFNFELVKLAENVSFPLQ